MSHTKIYLFIFIFLTFTSALFAQKNIVILHTNDSHSRIEPVPATDNSAPNMGGVVRRASFVDQVRLDNKNVLLFDSGDFLQGTPYFNLFKGKVEIEAMNMMKYDAATIGNHEFDYGLDELEKVIRKANFPFISSNYVFTGTQLDGLIKPYIIINKDGVKIGVIAVNIQPQGLIAEQLYKGIKYLSPYKIASDLATDLKLNKKCDIVICLSHLGIGNDLKLAQESRNIDIILGGHSHTFMKEPEFVENIEGKKVMIQQTNGRGVYVGMINVVLEKAGR
ncbi:MAG: metallophosphatase [Dysgonamonadaceae bacterium]|nr:metallophosphatase [Dysgonamonadaceae bacterium]MDD3310019.1 metallophosphatase [Dysgonamonadaceae bacterium]MDD3900020.1 metallophosphatase [Dysgonamonadaceae bacterium]MDD4398770.1 metallophosphatase [Dysgonamonadaceae bacterium]